MIRPRNSLIGLAVSVSICLLQPACTTVVSSDPQPGESKDDSLDGRILDLRANRFIERDELMRRAATARFVVLGEVHDNVIHHRLQAEILEAMLQQGRRPALAMEQFDREHQPSLDAARASGELDPERIADAGRFDRKGWRWPDYRPLIQLAVTNGLAILAANLSREDARAVMRSGRAAEGLPATHPTTQIALERDIVDGHCGFRPPDRVLAGMVEAQRARDAWMAKTLAGAQPSGAVLIAGTGHARRDRGVPAYLPSAMREGVLSIGYIELDPDGRTIITRLSSSFDVAWFTPRAEREDPCRNFRLP